MRSQPTTKQDCEQIWQHFNRLQKRIMATKTTKKEFFAEPEEERLRFYEWLQEQCGQFACHT